MKLLCLIPLSLAACASAPEQLESVNDHINRTRPYQFYYGNDNRYLKEGEGGNCAARSFTKMVELKSQGINAKTEKCIRQTDHQPHQYTVAELMGKVYVLDGDVGPYEDRNCVKRKGE